MKINHLEFQVPNFVPNFKMGRKLVLATTLSLALTGCSLSPAKEEEKKEVVTALEINDPISVSPFDLEQLHLVLCNNQCNLQTFNKTVEKLEALGVSVSEAYPGDDILKEEGITVVTMAGCIYDKDSSVILGQYDNNRVNNSDILALAMKASFKANDLAIDGIRPGIASISSDTGLTRRVPTATEANLDETSSFVAIALGNKIPFSEADKISDAIVEGVLRATYEIKRNPQADYLYRITDGDTLGDLENLFDVNKEELIKSNKNLKNDIIQMNDMVIHPSAYDGKAFKTTSEFALSRSKSL